LIAGILVATLVSLVSWRFFEDGSPFYTFAITLIAVFLVVWFRVMSWVFHKLELLPAKKLEPMEISLKSNDGRRLQLFRFKSVTPSEFYRIGEMIDGGGDLSHGSLVPILGRASTEAFKTELIKEKLTEWKDPNEHRSGMVLTRTGRVVFRNYNRDLSNSPTLEVEDG
jgi:hypothetical protein